MSGQPSVPAEADRLLGKRLESYRVLELLGRRDTGTLYKAVHTGIHRQVTLKVLPASLGMDTVRRVRFHREIQALKDLRHPGIVEFLDGSLDSDPPYYAMEYVEGESLDGLMGEAAGAWPAEEVLRLAEELLHALEALHERGIVHRDLVPSAIMHDARGRFRVVDFGVVWADGWDPITARGETPGSPLRHAPEVELGKPADARSDLYQLGQLLHEAWTGRIRSPTEGVPALPIPLGPALPAGFPGWLERLLERDPALRFPDARQARNALDRVLEEGQGSEKVEEGGTVESREPAVRSRWPLLLLFASAPVLWWLLSPAEPATVFGVEAKATSLGLRLSWRTGLPEFTRVRLARTDGNETLLLRSSHTTRLHRIEMPLAPLQSYRFEILDDQGHPLHQGETRLPTDSLLHEELRIERPDHRSLAVAFRTRTDSTVELRFQRAGQSVSLTATGPGREHTFRIEGLDPGERLEEPILHLEEPGGAARDLPLDPTAFRSCLEVLESFLDRSLDRHLPLLVDLYERGELRVGRAGILLEALDREDFRGELEAQLPAFRSLLADREVPEEIRSRLYRGLTRIEDIDSVLWYMESAESIGIHRAYESMVRVETLPVLPPDSPSLRRIHGKPVFLLPAAVVSGFARLFGGFGAETGSPRVDIDFMLAREELAGLQDPGLLLTTTHWNTGAILEVTLNDRWILSLRRRSPIPWKLESGTPRPFRFREPDERVLHLLAPLPREHLVPGRNLLEIRVRPLQGIPLGETSILHRVHLLLR